MQSHVWGVSVYVTGSTFTSRFLWSEILCRLYKIPVEGTIDRGPPRVHTCKKITYLYTVNDPVVHVRVWRITETLK